MKPASACLITVALLASACAKGKEPAATSVAATLDSVVEHPHGFGHIESAVELKSGVLVVIDRKEKTLMLAEFAKGTAAPLGRTGAGPQEYGLNFGRLLPGGGDTVYFRDFQNQRILIIGPNGAPVRVKPFKTGHSAERSVTLRAVDRTGRFYASMSARMSSAQLVARIDSTGESDSLNAVVHRASPPPEKMQRDASGTFYQNRWGPDYMPVPVWAVLPDGRVAILRDSVYRVEFSDGPTSTLGPELSYSRIPVSKAERMARIDSIQTEYREAENKPMATEAGGVLEFRVVDPPVVSPTHPPFTELLASPDNRLFVRVPTGPTDRGTHYEILDSTGTRIGRVAIPPGDKLLTLGRAAMYTTRTDADGFVHIRRYALPAELRTNAKR